MPRPLRHVIPGQPVHVLQRGHNRAPCFHSERDRVLYVGLLEERARRHACAVHAYVLMSNHIHLLVSPPDAGGLSRMMRDVNQIYGQSVNRRHNRCGSVWQGRFKMSVVETMSYFLACQRYIELNPVRAAMVPRPCQYRWSSYEANAFGRPSVTITPHEIYLSLGSTSDVRQAAYRDLFGLDLTPETLGKIRASIHGSRPLRDDP